MTPFDIDELIERIIDLNNLIISLQNSHCYQHQATEGTGDTADRALVNRIAIESTQLLGLVK